MRIDACRSSSDAPIRFPRGIKEEFEQCLDRIKMIPDVSKVIVFGSWAKGVQSGESDIDVAVFFDTDNTFLLEQYRKASKACKCAIIDIQPQVFRADELDEPCGIVEEIVKFGVEYPI